MKYMTIKVSCPKCGCSWEENAYIGWRTTIENGGEIDTDCPHCSRGIEAAKYKVVGVWDRKSCRTLYKTKEELLDIMDGKPI